MWQKDSIFAPRVIRIWGMVRRTMIVLFLALVVPATSWACACSQPVPGPCAGLQKDDVVFLGTVTGFSVLPLASSGHRLRARTRPRGRGVGCRRSGGYT